MKVLWITLNIKGKKFPSQSMRKLILAMMLRIVFRSLLGSRRRRRPYRHLLFSWAVPLNPVHCSIQARVAVLNLALLFNHTSRQFLQRISPTCQNWIFWLETPKRMKFISRQFYQMRSAPPKASNTKLSLINTPERVKQNYWHLVNWRNWHNE